MFDLDMLNPNAVIEETLSLMSLENRVIDYLISVYSTCVFFCSASSPF